MPKAELITKYYVLTSDTNPKFKLRAAIHHNKQFDLTPWNDHKSETFMFRNSSKETLTQMAGLISAAANLAEVEHE